MAPLSAPDKPIPWTEYVLLVVLATMWGSAFSFMKIAVLSIPPLTAISIRTGIAGLLLLALMRWQGIRLPLDRDTAGSFLLVSLVNTAAPFMLIGWSLQYVDAGLGIILNSTTPIFAFLITWGLTRHEPIPRQKVLGVAAGITGVLLIVGTEALSGLGRQMVPQLAIVLASLSYAVSAIYGRTFREMSPMAPAAGSLLIGAAVTLPLSILIERPWHATPTARSLIALVLLSVMSTALGNVLYFRLLGTMGSLGTTAQSYLRVPVGVLIGMAMLGERLSPSGWLGLVFVMAGVVAMTMRTR